jgi:hypothetical protein
VYQWEGRGEGRVVKYLTLEMWVTVPLDSEIFYTDFTIDLKLKITWNDVGNSPRYINLSLRPFCFQRTLQNEQINYVDRTASLQTSWTDLRLYKVVFLNIYRSAHCTSKIKVCTLITLFNKLLLQMILADLCVCVLCYVDYENRRFLSQFLNGTRI